MADLRDKRWWPKLAEAKVHPGVELAFRLAYNGIYDCQDAFTAQAAMAALHATVGGGAVTAIDVVNAGTYSAVPTVTAIGGGGTGAKFSAVLNQNGGIRSVTINAGGSGYTSPPYLKVTGVQ